jgi:WD40 repeat protein
MQEISRSFVLTGHQGAIYDLSAYDEYSFLSAGSDKMIVKWKAEENATGEVIAQTTDAIYSIHYDRINHKIFAGQSTGGVHVIDPVSGKEERLLQLHQAPVFRIATFEGLPYLITGGGDGKVIVLNPEYQILKIFDLGETKIRSFAFHPIYNYLLAGDGRGSIHVINCKTLEIDHSFQAHLADFGVNCITISPDGKKYLTGSRDAHLNIYNAENHELIQSLPAHRAAIYSIAFHDAGKIFATASRDKTVKIWDAETFKVIQRIEKGEGPAHSYSVNACIWINDFVVSAGDDRNIVCYEIS